jgi:hypothetical protein
MKADEKTYTIYTLGAAHIWMTFDELVEEVSKHSCISSYGTPYQTIYFEIDGHKYVAKYMNKPTQGSGSGGAK